MLIKLLLSGLILYYFVCFAFVAHCFTTPGCDKKNGDGETQQQWDLARQAYPIYTRVIIAMCCVILSPFVVPYGLGIGWQLRKKWVTLMRTHHDYALVWTSPEKLPQEAREYIEQHTIEMIELGFSEVGIYLMKPEPPNYYGRLFISSSGVSFASLCDMDGSSFFSFNTIFESERFLETSPIDPPSFLRSFANNPRYTGQFLPGHTISSTFRRHQEKIVAVYSETSDRPLILASEQVCDALQYAGRLYGEELLALGRYGERPPEPILPEGRPYEMDHPLFPDTMSESTE